ncbi:MAG TPA: hypothetical protein VLZ74_05750 [Methylocella sp.]|nr:hypothetical protein [Methylocella sp.]
MADESGTAPPAEKPKHDQTFFLDLAAKGKDAWNAWRRDRANQDARVTFAGVDFSEAPKDQIDFEGFEFGDEADFSKCLWRGGKRVLYLSALPDEIDSKDFIGSNDFVRGSACFTGAIFGFRANFAHAVFGEGASFSHADFGDLADFGGTTFGWLANFNNAAFGDLVNFHGAAFDSLVVFEDAVFRGRSSFAGQKFEEWAKEFEVGAAKVRGAKRRSDSLEERHRESWSHSGSGPDRFLSLSFANARFHREATISGRTFKETADFHGARFYSPPDFDASTNLGLIDFSDVYIGFAQPGKNHWTSDSRIPLRLRALRKIVGRDKKPRS